MPASHTSLEESGSENLSVNRGHRETKSVQSWNGVPTKTDWFWMLWQFNPSQVPHITLKSCLTECIKSKQFTKRQTNLISTQLSTPVSAGALVCVNLILSGLQLKSLNHSFSVRHCSFQGYCASSTFKRSMIRKLLIKKAQAYRLPFGEIP